MGGYRTSIRTLRLGEHDFGQVWPAGRLLAEAMATFGARLLAERTALSHARE